MALPTNPAFQVPGVTQEMVEKYLPRINGGSMGYLSTAIKKLKLGTVLMNMAGVDPSAMKYGEVADEAALIALDVSPTPGTGTNGDVYIDTTSGDVYGPKTHGEWGTSSINVGSPCLTGDGAPSDEGTGEDGDYYVDLETGDVYGPKAEGAWGESTDTLEGDSFISGEGAPVDDEPSTIEDGGLATIQGTSGIYKYDLGNYGGDIVGHYGSWVLETGDSDVFTILDWRGTTEYRTIGAFVADAESLPESGDLYEMRVALDSGIPYEWDGVAWAPADRPMVCYCTDDKKLYLRGATATDWTPFDGGGLWDIVANTTALKALTGYADGNEVLVLDLGNGKPGRVVMDTAMGGAAAALPNYYGTTTSPDDRYTPDDADGGNQRWRVIGAFVVGCKVADVSDFETGVKTYQRTSSGSEACSMFAKATDFTEGDTVTITDDAGEGGEVERVYVAKASPVGDRDFQIGTNIATSLAALTAKINADIMESTKVYATPMDHLVHRCAEGVNRTFDADLDTGDGGWSDADATLTSIPAFKATHIASVTVTSTHLDPSGLNGIVKRSLGVVAGTPVPFRVTTLDAFDPSSGTVGAMKVTDAKVTACEAMTIGATTVWVVTVDLGVSGTPPSAGDTVMVEFGVL